MSNQPPSAVRFIALLIACFGLLVSVPIFLLVAQIFFAMPDVSFGLILLCWLASMSYGVVLGIRSLRAGGTTRLSLNRALGAAALTTPSGAFALILVWLASSLAAPW